jgi:hypothetical protein
VENLITKLHFRYFWPARCFTSGGLAEVLFFVILKMHLAKVIVAVVAMPS